MAEKKKPLTESTIFDMIAMSYIVPTPRKHLNTQAVGLPGIRKHRMKRNKRNKLAEYHRRINRR